MIIREIVSEFRTPTDEAPPRGPELLRDARSARSDQDAPASAHDDLVERVTERVLERLALYWGD